MVGVDEGLAKGQPGSVKGASRLVVGGEGIERLVFVMSPSRLTVRARVARGITHTQLGC